mmetsp:Transcript_15063/g.26710  ORF Transcript_15063/g.26710 Transcript_15063/m.26710 type:complete len:228 (-) Transcript_15063:888-1571(-)
MTVIMMMMMMMAVVMRSLEQRIRRNRGFHCLSNPSRSHFLHPASWRDPRRHGRHRVGEASGRGSWPDTPHPVLLILDPEWFGHIFLSLLLLPLLLRARSPRREPPVPCSPRPCLPWTSSIPNPRARTELTPRRKKRRGRYHLPASFWPPPAAPAPPLPPPQRGPPPTPHPGRDSTTFPSWSDPKASATTRFGGRIRELDTCPLTSAGPGDPKWRAEAWLASRIWIWI